MYFINNNSLGLVLIFDMANTILFNLCSSFSANLKLPDCPFVLYSNDGSTLELLIRVYWVARKV